MKKVSIIALSLAVSACATTYDGNPHNYTDGGDGVQGLLKARYDCLKEIEGYGSASSSNVNVNVSVNTFGNAGLVDCAALNMCVAGKGYIRQKTGSVKLPESFVVSCRP